MDRSVCVHIYIYIYIYSRYFHIRSGECPTDEGKTPKSRPGTLDCADSRHGQLRTSEFRT